MTNAEHQSVLVSVYRATLGRNRLDFGQCSAPETTIEQRLGNYEVGMLTEGNFQYVWRGE